MDESVENGRILLGKYRVESELGRGGMGIVVAARHVELGKRVAIKILLRQAMEYPGACERFVREARSAARLEGDHIAQVHDTGTLEDGTPYILMEYLDGQNLKAVVRERGALPAEEAALYVVQACEAVAEAHKQGIVHRDLKPANMMLTRRSSGAPCIKVLDFGISKNLDPAARLHDLTRSGVIMCSPGYMAPEQASHPKEVDPRSDIWALGVVLYELVTGMLPFYADSGMELVAQILQKEPQRPMALVPGLSDEIERIILKCIDKAPEKRFQTVTELMVALRPFVAMEHVVEPSRKLLVAEMEAPCPEWFDPADKTISDTRTRVIPVKGVGATIKLPEAAKDETRTRVLPKTFVGKTITLPDAMESETNAAVIADKRGEGASPIVNTVDEEFSLPMHRRRGGLVACAILTVAVVLLGAAVHVHRSSAQTQTKNDETLVVSESNPTPPASNAPPFVPEPPKPSAAVSDKPSVEDKPAQADHSSAKAPPVPNSPKTPAASTTSAIPGSSKPEPKAEPSTVRVDAPSTEPETDIYADSPSAPKPAPPSPASPASTNSILDFNKAGDP